MKNAPINLFKNHSVYTFIHGFSYFYCLDPELKKDVFLGIKRQTITPLQIIDGTNKKVYVYEKWIAKKEFKPLKIRWCFLYRNSHPSRGHRGAVGEAVNTLIANIMNVPAHRLAGVCINFFTGHVTAIYSKIAGYEPLGELLTFSKQNVEFILRNTILGLIKILDSEIMHADAHAGNIFYNTHNDSIRLIDFEMAIKINSEKHIAAGCMLSKLYTPSIAKLIPFNEYIDLIASIFESKFLCGETKEAIALIRKFPSNISYKERTTLLNLVSLKKPALANLVRKKLISPSNASLDKPSTPHHIPSTQ